MIKSVTVRNICIGEGRPKVCIPLAGRSEDEIVKQASLIGEYQADLVEFRADYWEMTKETESRDRILGEIREKIKDIPLIYTFRSSGEGGESQISFEEYRDMLLDVAAKGKADLIDVEAFMEADETAELILAIQAHHVPVIASFHDFEKTPSQALLIPRMGRMQDMGADIVKVAVMPQSKQDVFALMEMTENMVSHFARCPFVTMSMSPMGLISRLSGEVFGSAITFGSAGAVSAPGQIDAADLRTVLDIIHNNMG